MQEFKFALRNYQGICTHFFTGHKEDLQVTTSTKNPAKKKTGSVAHHIIIIDRSGSMWGLLDGLKQVIKRSLRNDEIQNPNLKITLLSYASSGDVITHFQRVPITEINTPNSKESKAIDAIRTAGLTGISQSLEKALDYVDKNESTLVTLHSDGYANDASSYDERNRFSTLLPEFKNSGIIINTISHASRSDFNTLNYLANETGGRCIFAEEDSVVETSLTENSAQIVLGGSKFVDITADGAHTTCFVDLTTKRVIANHGDLCVKVFGETPSGIVLRFYKVDEATYQTSTADDLEETDRSLLYIFAKAMIAMGKFNFAKYAIVSTRNTTLLSKHYRAMVNEDIAQLTTDLDDIIFNNPSISYSNAYGLKDDRLSVLTLCKLLEKYKNDVQVNIGHLRDNYIRRTVKRIPGTRDENNKFIAPSFVTKPIELDGFVEISSVEINKNTANINMTLVDKVNLYENKKNASKITNIKGVDVSALTEFRSYTIVGDGRINLSELQIKISNEDFFNILETFGLVTGSFDKNTAYTINLADRPLLPMNNKFQALHDTFQTVGALRMLVLMLEAVTKDSSSDLSADQITELRNHCISKSLNINIPTTVEYDDEDQAFRDGIIERRPFYRIDIGTTTIQNMADFRTSSDVLKTFYVIKGKNVDAKAKWSDLWDPNNTIERKKISGKTKVSTADVLALSVLDSALGIEDISTITSLFQKVGLEKHTNTIEKFAERTYKTTSFGKELFPCIKDINDTIDELYADIISPLVFYIGCTGLLPDEIDAQAYNSEDIQKRHPHLKISEKEENGTFFEFEDDIISIYIDDQLVSLDK